MKVLIIGAGLGGPALALALAKRGIQSTLFEIRSERSDSGGSISLAPNALRVLDRSCGVYEEIKSRGFSYDRFQCFDEKGFRYGEAVFQDGEYASLRIMRSTLHQALIEMCEKKGIKIVWGAKLIRIEEEGDEVTANFKDGSSAKGDLLIGADGIHSQVRGIMLGSEAPEAKFIGSCTVNSFVDASDIKLKPGMTLPITLFMPEGFFMIIPMEPNGKRLSYGISIACDEKRSREEWRAFETSGEAARLAKEKFAHYDDELIRSLMDRVDEKQCRVWAPYSFGCDLPTWHKGRVALLGDAAHTFPPNGQGSAMAFEDAALLSRMLAERSIGDALFDRFRTLRMARLAKAKKLSQGASSVKASSAGWGWYLKSWAIYGVFLAKGGVMRDARLTGWDAEKEVL